MRWVSVRSVMGGVVLAATLAGTSAPAAANAACATLQARLQRIDARSADPTLDAIRRQRAELARGQRQAATCIGASCQAIEATVRSMQANLARLEAIARARGAGDGEGERRRILNALAAQRCAAPPPLEREAARPPNPGGLIGAFFPFLVAGPAQTSVDPSRSPVPPIPSMDEMRRQRIASVERDHEEPSFGRGRYRTLCVRTCDGYFWPISFSVPSAAFGRDEQACRAACPNMEVALYVHRNPGAWSEAATALDGTPYSDLPTANAFRREFNPACQCQPVLTNAAAEALDDRQARSDAAPPHFATQRLRATLPAETGETDDEM